MLSRVVQIYDCQGNCCDCLQGRRRSCLGKNVGYGLKAEQNPVPWVDQALCQHKWPSAPGPLSASCWLAYSCWICFSIFLYVYCTKFLFTVYYSILNVEIAVFFDIIGKFLPDYLVINFMVILWESELTDILVVVDHLIQGGPLGKSHIFNHTVECCTVATVLSTQESVTSALRYWCKELRCAVACTRCASGLFYCVLY